MTDEQIEQCHWVLKALTQGDLLYPILMQPEWSDKVDSLCELARIGAAVKPRPISEAPKDRKQELLQFSDPSLDANVHGGPYVDIGRKIIRWAHTFIPISALSTLPTPEQQDTPK